MIQFTLLSWGIFFGYIVVEAFIGLWVYFPGKSEEEIIIEHSCLNYFR